MAFQVATFWDCKETFLASTKPHLFGCNMPSLHHFPLVKSCLNFKAWLQVCLLHKVSSRSLASSNIQYHHQSSYHISVI